MIDIVYLAFNRLEFTMASLGALIANTDWSLVRRLIVYDDGSTDGTREHLAAFRYPVDTQTFFEKIGGPVAITNHYLSRAPAEIFVKIDNDAMLPPGWLEESLSLMEKYQKVDLLGLQAVYHPAQLGRRQRACRMAKHIGGIGLMRRRCFLTLPGHWGSGGRSGFTHWQWKNSQVVKAWIDPSIPMCLLDRMPIEPWAGLSQQYVKLGWQRKVAPYTETYSPLWAWWINGK